MGSNASLSKTESKLTTRSKCHFGPLALQLHAGYRVICIDAVFGPISRVVSCMTTVCRGVNLRLQTAAG